MYYYYYYYYYCRMILDSIVRMTTVPELTIDEQWFNPQQRRFLEVSTTSCDPPTFTHIAHMWRPGRKAEHSPQSSATVDNVCVAIYLCSPILLYVAMLT